MNFISTFTGAAKALTSNASRNTAKMIFQLKKHAPTIAVFGGVLGTAAAGIWAVEKSVDEAPEVLQEVAATIEGVKKQDLGPAALTKAYALGTWKVVKLYSGPILVEFGSVAGILWGYRVINGRFVAMTATAAALERANKMEKENFGRYREALEKKFGENFEDGLEYDLDIPLNCDKRYIEYKDEETGEIKKEPAQMEFTTGLGDVISPYAVIFDETASEWSNDPEYNKYTLRRIQQTCDDLLKARGYLFLNEVYNELGLPATRAGQMVGWLMDGRDKTCGPIVDFGIYDVQYVPNRSEFINNLEPSILLDFNVDGVIWDKL